MAYNIIPQRGVFSTIANLINENFQRIYQQILGLDGSGEQAAEDISQLESDVSALQSGKANDADVVHKAGTETITGNKTFTGTVKLPLQNSGILVTDENGVVQSDSIDFVTDVTYEAGDNIFFLKKTINGTKTNIVQVEVTPNSNSTGLVTSGGIYAALVHKVDKIPSPTDNAIVRFDGTSGSIQNSGVTINDNNHLTAAKLITSGGTSSQFVKGDGSLDSNYYFRPGDRILTNDVFASKKALYITKLDNILYSAHIRYVVTHKLYDNNGNFIEDLNTNLFDCNYEKASRKVKDGYYAELYIGVVEETELANTSKILATYCSGELLLTFYNNMICSGMTAKLYTSIELGNTPSGWYNLSPTVDTGLSINNYNNIYKINVSPSTYVAAFKIRYDGKTTGNYGASLTQVEWYGTRVGVSQQSVVTKYPIAQDLWGEVTAPKFITRNGASSQFVKGDGSLDSNTYAGAQTSGGAANKAVSIPFGQVDSTSTSTAFTATVDGITELRDGVCVYLKNGVVTSAASCTLNVNGLGAKPMYNTMAATTAISTQWNVNYTMLFIYNSTRVSGGCWDVFFGYYADTNSIGYQLRTNNNTLPASDTSRYNKIFFTSADNTKWIPASADSTNNATSARPVNQRPINPFGAIVYLSSTSSIAAGTNIGTGLWQQYPLNLGYSFNRTGAALTLTTRKPVFIKCAPQDDGSAIIDADVPYVQDLPTSEDGKIYIFLGVAYSATQVEMQMVHPVYYYKNGSINLWTGTGVQNEIDSKADSATTLAGYGITDAKIEDKSIILGENSITPIEYIKSATAQFPVILPDSEKGLMYYDTTLNKWTYFEKRGSEKIFHSIFGNSTSSPTIEMGTFVSKDTDTSYDISAYKNFFENPCEEGKTYSFSKPVHSCVFYFTNYCKGTTQDIPATEKQIQIAGITGGTATYTFIAPDPEEYPYIEMAKTGDGTANFRIYEKPITWSAFATEEYVDDKLGDIETLLASI